MLPSFLTHGGTGNWSVLPFLMVVKVKCFHIIYYLRYLFRGLRDFEIGVGRRMQQEQEGDS